MDRAARLRTDSDRLYVYVESYFQRSERTAWPTVKQVQGRFGWTHARIRDAVEGDGEGRLQTTSYFCKPPEPFGDHFVESLRPIETPSTKV